VFGSIFGSEFDKRSDSAFSLNDIIAPLFELLETKSMLLKKCE